MKFRINNTAMIKDISGLLKYIKPMVKELTLKNLNTKLNVNMSLKIIKYERDDEPIIKPHHLTHTAVSIPADNWLDKEYNKLSK